MWLWHVFGREIIKFTLQENIFTIKHDIFGLGRIKTFQNHEISNIRAAGYFGVINSFLVLWGIIGGTIAFDYKGKTYRFGIQFEEKEAKELVEKIKSYLPHLRV